jgi:hypothetical protein
MKYFKKTTVLFGPTCFSLQTPTVALLVIIGALLVNFLITTSNTLVSVAVSSLNQGQELIFELVRCIITTL